MLISVLIRLARKLMKIDENKMSNGILGNPDIQGPIGRENPQRSRISQRLGGKQIKW